ncbi:MAG: hypothetical protein ACFE85_17785, partial [Candidatus Hodarchaeota archaeon]
ELGYMNKALEYIDLAYEKSQGVKSKSKILDILIAKIMILNKSERPREALKTINEAEHILSSINQTNSTKYKEKFGYILLGKCGYFFNMGDFNKAIKHADKTLTIAKEIRNKKLIMMASKSLAMNYSLKGYFDHSYEYVKRVLALARELNNKQEIIGALNGIGMYFIEKGDFDQAIDNLEESLSLCYEVESFKTIVVLSSLFEAYYYKGSLEKAEQYLIRMKRIGALIEFNSSKIFYLLAKAMLLKEKPEKINQLKAKEILKHLVDGIKPFSGILYTALILLCDLYLKDLSETQNLGALDEMQPYINQLINIAKSQQSFWLLVEIYSLQAKLKLISFEFEEAKQFLNIALDVAKEHGQKLLEERISMEQDRLLNEETKWEKLRESKATMAELIDLARVEEQLAHMLRKRLILKRTI